MGVKKDNLVMIGMPGVGKSTIGVIAAKMLGMHFLDADIMIQEKEKRLLSEIIAEDGVDGFLDIENAVNASIETSEAVISTGGSVIYGKEAMQHLGEIGTIVYLRLSYEQLTQRLGDLKNRGVVLKDGQDLKGLYDERTPLYERYADLVIDEDDLNIEETLSCVVEEYRKYRESHE